MRAGQGAAPPHAGVGNFTAHIQKIQAPFGRGPLPSPAMDTALHTVLERVRAAAANTTALRLCGGGSKDFHGQALTGEVLDLRPLAGIVSYEPTELVVTVRAGTPLQELEAALAEHGQALACEPPHFATPAHQPTVGGMVAAGWSGPARASVGAVRDFMLGVELINGQGELLRYGGQVMKNVAGYDVSRLMAGSWGTLGVITEVSLKVLPVAPAEATLCFTVDQATALAALNRWGGQPLPLNASCWTGGQLWLRLRGAVAAVEAACTQLGRELGGQRLEPAQAQSLWQSLREQQHAWFAQRRHPDVLWRLSLPQTAPALELPAGVAAPLVEWHGGLRWVQAPRAMGKDIVRAAQTAGGSAIIFRAEGADQISNSAIFAPQMPALQAVHAQIKRAFDPHGIFNPGRTGLAA